MFRYEKRDNALENLSFLVAEKLPIPFSFFLEFRFFHRKSHEYLRRDDDTIFLEGTLPTADDFSSFQNEWGKYAIDGKKLFVVFNISH